MIEAIIMKKIEDLKQSYNTWKSDWTAARAAKLDNLDATISSRATAQTVMSSVQTTTNKVKEYLDAGFSQSTQTVTGAFTEAATVLNQELVDIKKSSADARNKLVTGLSQLGISATSTETVNVLAAKVSPGSVPNLRPENITKGVNVGGVVGSRAPYRGVTRGVATSIHISSGGSSESPASMINDSTLKVHQLGDNRLTFGSSYTQVVGNGYIHRYPGTLGVYYRGKLYKAASKRSLRFLTIPDKLTANYTGSENNWSGDIAVGIGTSYTAFNLNVASFNGSIKSLVCFVSDGDGFRVAYTEDEPVDASSFTVHYNNSMDCRYLTRSDYDYPFEADVFRDSLIVYNSRAGTALYWKKGNDIRVFKMTASSDYRGKNSNNERGVALSDKIAVCSRIRKDYGNVGWMVIDLETGAVIKTVRHPARIISVKYHENSQRFYMLTDTYELMYTDDNFETIVPVFIPENETTTPFYLNDRFTYEGASLFIDQIQDTAYIGTSAIRNGMSGYYSMIRAFNLNEIP